MTTRQTLLLCALTLLGVHPVCAQQDVAVAFSPHQGATSLIVETINAAQTSVKMAAYSFTSPLIAAALVNACNHGRDVKVVLDKSQRKSGVLSHYFASTCVELRINSRYAIMHNKFIIVDDKTVQLGSFNYTKAAENKNAENVMVLYDMPIVAKEYSSQWTKLWNESFDYYPFGHTTKDKGTTQ